jgi:hypothetical protein
MTKIICRASDCIFWDDGVCSSEDITYDPELGCLVYESIEDVLLDDDEDVLDDEPLEWDEDEDEELDDDWDV